MFSLKDFNLREYQKTIVGKANKKNLLVVLPTGLGKTAISVKLSLDRLNLFPDKKIILTAPTKPLCNQHFNTFLKNTNIKEQDITLLTGETKPEKRIGLFKDSKIIIATPQTLKMDVLSKRIDLSEVVLLTIDEAHRAVADYSYTFVAKEYFQNANNPKILGLTASPGSDLDKIQEVCKNLYIEDIESRSESDIDVKPYIQELKINWEKVDLTPKFKEVADLVNNAFQRRINQLKAWGLAGKVQKNISKTQLLDLQRRIHGRIAKGSKDARNWVGISLVSQCIKLSYAQELIETQSPKSFLNYIKDIRQQARSSKSKAVKSIAEDSDIKEAFLKAEKLTQENIKHPKLIKLKEIIVANLSKSPKIIVFSSFRDTASEIVDFLNEENNIKSELFVGQAKKRGTGLSQKEQSQMLKDFSQSKFNVLVGTSITEEGIDIPKVDFVVFYEPVPSAIRTVQRRGRTARTAKGGVIILLTKKTKDEAYHWVSVRKEKKMKKIIDDMKKKLVLETQKSIQEAIEPKSDVTIFADTREKASPILKHLSSVNLVLKKLDVGDYMLGDGVICERKTKKDLMDSLIDGRLMEQLKNLKDTANKPFLILEGTEDLYSVRQIHPNAVRGVISSIAVSYQIPIIHTKDAKDTAEFLRIIARRMQLEGHKNYIEANPSPKSLKDKQLSILSSIPEVGPKLANRFYSHFSSLRDFFMSTSLSSVQGIGKKKAEKISELLDKEFDT